jgi:hypothetical protein
MNNLDLWNKVEKTNPKYTKKAKVGGNEITAISPQYQIMNATEQFGPYGETWGFRHIEFDYSITNTPITLQLVDWNTKEKEEVVSILGLVGFKAIFFFPNGEFEITNSIKIFTDNKHSKIDDNFAKKLETDALTKALSKLGFNADIFLGKFDDLRYVEEMKKEFTIVLPKAIPMLTDAVIDSVIAKGKDMIIACLESIKKGERIATQVQELKLKNANKPNTVYIQDPDPYANQEIS